MLGSSFHIETSFWTETECKRIRAKNAREYNTSREFFFFLPLHKQNDANPFRLIDGCPTFLAVPKVASHKSERFERLVSQSSELRPKNARMVVKKEKKGKKERKAVTS